MAKKLTKSQLTTKKREEVLAMLTELLSDLDEEVMREGGNSIVFPSTDDEGNELFVKITVAIPRGSRLDNEAYDGYAAAEAYKDKCDMVAAKAEQRAKERKAKAEADRKKREAAKAKKEAEAAELAEFIAKRDAAKEGEGE